MPLIAEKERARFTITGVDFAPAGLAEASERDRRNYWRQVAVLARDEKYRELKKGIGVDGAALLPRKYPRRDRASGRVLVPHWNDSRFVTQLRWEGTASGAVLWWRFPWGKIVGYHAVGVRYRSGRVIVRDVVGLTLEAQERVRERAAKWWEGNVGKVQAAPERQFLRLPEPPPGVVYKPYEAFDTGFRKPPPRPRGSIFQPRPGPGFRPMPPTGPVTTAVPPWELQRHWADVMARGWRGEVGEAELDRLLEAVRRTQAMETVRDTLRRLGVIEPVRDWDQAIDLLRRQVTQRAGGGFPGVFPPIGPRGGPGRPRGIAGAIARVGVGLGLGYVPGKLVRRATGGEEP
jgi:hypothetical protein